MIKLNNEIININHFPDGTIRILECPLVNTNEIYMVSSRMITAAIGFRF